MGCRSTGVGVEWWVPLVACCDGHEGSGSWTVVGTISGGGGGVLIAKVSNPPPALDRVPVDGKALHDFLGWTGGIGDRSSGGGDAVSTGDSRGSSTDTLDCPIGGVGVGLGPSFRCRQKNDLRVPCPGCGGRSVPEEGRDGAAPNCGAGSIIRSNACRRGEALGGCLLVCSPVLVLAAARVHALVLVEIWLSVCSPVSTPRR